MEFLRGVMDGSKKLFKLKEIHIMDNLPRYPEICLQEIWDASRANPQLRPYFPDKTLGSARPPNRTFLFTVTSPGAFDRLP